MTYVYASRKGHVEQLVQNLGLDAMKIVDGSEVVEQDFILFTYTDGQGIVPPAVEKFLAGNGSKLQGVVVSGNSVRHPDTFCGAGQVIAAQYNVPVLANVEDGGDSDDLARIQAQLA